jgi:DeoR/GlpR family transcriptional regulator of sugar metabolism
MSFDEGEAAVARAMLSRAENVIVLADSSKCGRIAPFVIGELVRFDYLVCESAPGQILQNALNQHSVKIV